MAWIDDAEDVEVVMKFRRLVTERAPSLFSFRAQVKTLEPRLYKILLDGLAAREEQSKATKVQEHNQ